MVRFVLCAVLAMTCVAAVGAPRRGEDVRFKKVVIDKEFRAEGVAVADVNRDGKLDIIAGNLWYEAPNWTPHEIAPVQKYDGATGYSNCFICFASDVNGDGWVDEIVIGMPGDKSVWRENPKGKPGPWPEHLMWRSACNESPNFADLLGNKKPVPVYSYDEKAMAWYEPGPKPEDGWVAHTISSPGDPGCARFSHGLGVGDVNGDGRADVLVKEGYWEAPADRTKEPWQFVKANLGPDCAHMLVYDVNKDGLPDVISSSAHNRGVWWYEQKKGANGPEFVQHTIDDTISETHSMVLADINGDGVMDVVTGKRFWAHGPTGDVGASEPAMLVWYELRREGGQVKWVRHDIDNDSGVGTQFVVADVNKDGLPDIVVANKKGVFDFEQIKPGRK